MFHSPPTTPRVYAGETCTIQFDFNADLDDDETINSASAAVSIWTGIDPDVSSMLIGPTSIDGGVVQQRVGVPVPYGFKAGVVYSVWFFVKTSLGQLLVGSSKVICSYEVPPTSAIDAINSLISSLPNVQRGDPVPSPGVPFINSSGFVVVSQPSVVTRNYTMRIYGNSLLAALPGGNDVPDAGLGFFDTSGFLVISQPSLPTSAPELLPLMTSLFASLDNVQFGDAVPPVGNFFINESGFLVVSI